MVRAKPVRYTRSLHEWPNLEKSPHDNQHTTPMSQTPLPGLWPGVNSQASLQDKR